jgi:hypothetical protein
MDNFEIKQKSNKYRTISGLNLKIKKFLEEENIEFKMEYRISALSNEKNIITRYYDFAVGNKVLEIQGRYYHADPRLFKENDIIKFPKSSFTAKELWDRDKAKKELAETKGFLYKAIWETEIKKDWENVKQEIKNFIAQ